MPRGLCGDPRIFDDLTKVPQVFRNPGGRPALQNACSAVLVRYIRVRALLVRGCEAHLVVELSKPMLHFLEFLEFR